MTLAITDTTIKPSLQPISQIIEQVDVQGQHLLLEAPIRLTGSLNRPALQQQVMEQVMDSKAVANQDNSAKGWHWQIGVDEAGRGPLLGDVVVSAVLLPSAWSGEIEAQILKGTPLAILTDSKQLSEKKRDKLYPLIQTHAIAYISAEVPAAVIDQLNILQATMMGMRLCSELLVLSLWEALTAELTQNQLRIQLLYDGNRCPELDMALFAQAGMTASQIEQQAWVKGDGRHTSIAAASVIAKVGRDSSMLKLAKQYPHFGIEKHKGYPTKVHLQAIAEHGVLPMHRRSFAPIRRALDKCSYE